MPGPRQPVQAISFPDPDALSARFELPAISSFSTTSTGNLRDNDAVVVLGCESPGDGGGGLFRWSATRQAARAGLVFDGVTGSFLRVYNGAVNPQWFGAKGDNSNDDTSAIQAAIDFALTASGGWIQFDRGTYKITAELSIPFSAGWRITADSRGGVIIRQYTSGLSIFRLTTALTHSWSISGLTLSYPTAQTSGAAIYFALDTGSGFNGFFGIKLESLTFDHCFRCIANNTVSGQCAVWGLTIEKCTYGGTNKGAFLLLAPSPVIGQPMISVAHCHLDCSAATETVIGVLAADSMSVTDTEFNGGTFTNFNVISVQSSQNVILRNVKHEGATFGVSGSTGSLWNFYQSNAVVIGGSVNGCALVDGSTTNIVQAVEAAGSGGHLSIIGFWAGGLTGTGSFYLSGANHPEIFSGIILAGNAPTFAGYVNGGALPKFLADRVQTNVSESVNNSDKNLTASSARYQYYNTNLTADRQIFLPTTGLYDGLMFTITRYGGGAFTLFIRDGLTGKNLSFGPSVKGSVTYRAQGTGEWLPVSYSTF